MDKYLAASEYIDWQEPTVLAQAITLAEGAQDDEQIAQRCFEFVRDHIKHSWDHQLNPVTCKASDVLKHRTGYCYAKSHLLAALLRANKIPTGLCYQRLTIGTQPPFCLHGLNAVYLKKYGWYRMDARGEMDLPEIWTEPLPLVILTLLQGKSYLEVANNLPDVLLFAT